MTIIQQATATRARYRACSILDRLFLMSIVLIISINKKTFFTKYSNCQTCETCAITFILPNKKKDSEEKWAVMKICKLFFLVPSKQYGIIFQIFCHHIRIDTNSLLFIDM